ncbi:MAG: YjbQ family protein [Actinomycetota bacterium]
MKTERLSITTGHTRATVDLTAEVRRFVAGHGDGLLNVSIPHATAGLVLMELGSGSEADLWDCLDALLPRDRRYAHSHGSPGHGADHVLPAFISPALTLPVIDGELSLGIWQSIVLVDSNLDNPQREVVLAFLTR